MFLRLAVEEGAPPQAAEELLLEMDAAEVEPSSHIFQSLLKAYAHHGDAAGAEGVMARRRGAARSKAAPSSKLTARRVRSADTRSSVGQGSAAAPVTPPPRARAPPRAA